jgi:hypothetical protein
MNRESAIITRGTPLISGPRTYVAFGAMRGGTTMVAGVMRALGIYMGDDISESNQENAQFANAELPAMVEAVKRNNSKHDIWGWKFPHAADYVDRLWPQLVNPHMICVYRDPVANGQGLQRWHPFGPMHAMQEVMLRQQKNMNLISRRGGAPTIMISYEKAERNKDLFLEEFSALLGLVPDRAAFDFEGFMAASSYKNINDFRKS